LFGAKIGIWGIGGWVTYVYLFYRKVGSRQKAVYPVKCEARAYFSGVGKKQ